jgi:hypothetical protein
MKIYHIAKGFVTNSSSTNYWLNDSHTETGEKASSSPTATATKNVDRTTTSQDELIQHQTQNTSSSGTGKMEPEAQESNLGGLYIGILFSVIALAAILIKKTKNK